MRRLTIILTALICVCTSALADLCDAAQSINVGTACNYTTYKLNTGAGSKCPTDCGWVNEGYKEVWLKALMPSTGRMAVATQGNYIDGFMAIYTGSCDNLKPYRCSSNGRLPEVLEVSDIAEGEIVYIRIALVDENSVGVCVYQLENIEIPECSSASAASDNCAKATLIQSPQGYCGNTSASYSVDIPGNLQNVFCGSIENNSWLQFVAAEEEASLNIFVNNCERGIGIQMRIYGTDDCYHFTPYSNCWNPAIETNGVVTATGLTPGKRYYLMIDGYAGDVCDYTISGGKGVEMPQTYIEEVICKGETYNKYGFNVSEGGVYRQELIGPTGKDSLVVLSLTTKEPVYTYLNRTIYACERYTENGFNVNKAGKYNLILKSASGCDSIVELNLTVKPQKEYMIDATICKGESYTLNGFNVSKAGTYTRTLKTEQGCDSIVTLVLEVNDALDLAITGDALLCQGNSTTLTASGGNYYMWYDADDNLIGTGETLTVTPTATTSYKVVSDTKLKCPSHVTDCQGNRYRTTLIGEQCWMAENLRCTKYDTESPLAGQIIQKSEINSYGGYSPYYVVIPFDSDEAHHWSFIKDDAKKTMSVLYNWGAALGLTENEDRRTNVYRETSKTDTFQGICPNGWHVPSFEEYVYLVISLGRDEDDAIALRAKDSWYSGRYNGKTTINGDDSFGFTLYPAGVFSRSEFGIKDIENVGYEATLWCSGPAGGEGATCIIAECHDPSMKYNDGTIKYQASSLRCIKN